MNEGHDEGVMCEVGPSVRCGRGGGARKFRAPAERLSPAAPTVSIHPQSWVPRSLGPPEHIHEHVHDISDIIYAGDPGRAARDLPARCRLAGGGGWACWQAHGVVWGTANPLVMYVLPIVCHSWAMPVKLGHGLASSFWLSL